MMRGKVGSGDDGGCSATGRHWRGGGSRYAFWVAACLALLPVGVGAQMFNDVWALDLTTETWTEITPSGPSPTQRHWFPYAHDTLRNRLIVSGDLGGDIDTWALNLSPGSESWTLLSNDGRWQLGGVYDSARDRFVVLGYEVAILNLNTNTWSYQTTTGVDPSPVSFAIHSTLYDPVSDRYLLCGGGLGGGAVDTVRSLDPNTLVWSELAVAPGPRPSPRHLTSVAFDPIGHRMLLFGGSYPGGSGVGISVGDTWELTLTPGTETWTELITPTSPPDRCQNPAAFDTTRSELIIFSGLQYCNPTASCVRMLEDTWKFDGSDWTEITSLPGPVRRRGAAGIYDATGDRFILFGGQFVEDNGNPPPTSVQSWGVYR